ncbi:MAG: hypothetical protein ACXVGA_00925 [Mycobacteriaceae bacterium]
MACASSCRTQDHQTYGQCLRAKNVATTGLESTAPSFSTTHQKAWDKELDLYESAIKQGIQPEGTKTAQIREALDASDKVGAPYRADE